jgi:DNA-binding protein HU-beta
MTKADIVEKVASGTGLTKLETEAIIEGFIHFVKEKVLKLEVLAATK